MRIRLFTILILSLLSLASLTLRAGDYDALYKDLPVQMEQPSLPDIPEFSVSITEFGACGDGVSLNTEAFAKAVSKLAKQGGGHLIVPAGIYLTGPIVLKDRIDLHLEKGAFILFSPDKALYLKDGKGAVPCISASKRKDVSITGEGIIDGNGKWWRAVKRSKVSDVEWKEFLKMGGTVSDDGSIWYPFDLKGWADVAATSKEQEKMRTHLIRFTDCERVLLTGVTLQNSPKFHLVPQRCKDVVIDGVTLRCPWNAQNGDGIDLMNCRNALVAGCLLDVGDDGICLKAGAGENGLKAGPCENVLVTRNTVCHAHGGFVIGSEYSGGMFNIVVRDNVFTGTDTGLRFKSAPGRGGKCRDIFISDIMMSDIKGEAVVFETSYSDRPVGREGSSADPSDGFWPDFSGISISNVACSLCKTGVKATGTLETVHDIVLADCVFVCSEDPIVLSDPAMISLMKVRFEKY